MTDGLDDSDGSGESGESAAGDGRDSGDDGDGSTDAGLDSADAFSLLGDATRLAIVSALHDAPAESPVRFSELYDDGDLDVVETDVVSGDGS